MLPRLSLAALLALVLAVPAGSSEDMVLVPAGWFTMGTADGPADQRPPHRVYLEAYYIGRREVTNREFRRFLTDTRRYPPEGWARAAERWGEEAPAVHLSFEDAQAYCRWAGVRLPSEAEWERAARGGDARRYPWGNGWEPRRCASAREEPLPVGSLPEGASPYGCLDMAGNAWEWTASWYTAYPGSSYRCEEYGEKYRVLRGGSWQHRSPEFLSACRRGWNLSMARLNGTGFRIAQDAP